MLQYQKLTGGRALVLQTCTEREALSEHCVKHMCSDSDTAAQDTEEKELRDSRDFGARAFFTLPSANMTKNEPQCSVSPLDPVYLPR